MQTLTLFPIEESLSPKWENMVTTVSSNERQIIAWIMRLHNGGKCFDVDACYSTGRFWDGLPKPLLKYDIHPQTDDTVKANAENLPLDDGSVSSIMFDPPFVVAPNPKPGIIRDRFSCYQTIDQLWTFYRNAINEFYRVLAVGGMLTIKCQDTVSSAKQHLSHVAIINAAESVGFYSKDLFILIRDNVLWSPNMEHQQHARKTHCYFLVFTKGYSRPKRS